jgi:hypothetical protein
MPESFAAAAIPANHVAIGYGEASLGSPRRHESVRTRLEDGTLPRRVKEPGWRIPGALRAREGSHAAPFSCSRSHQALLLERGSGLAPGVLARTHLGSLGLTTETPGRGLTHQIRDTRRAGQRVPASTTPSAPLDRALGTSSCGNPPGSRASSGEASELQRSTRASSTSPKLQKRNWSFKNGPRSPHAAHSRFSQRTHLAEESPYQQIGLVRTFLEL